MNFYLVDVLIIKNEIKVPATSNFSQFSLDKLPKKIVFEKISTCKKCRKKKNKCFQCHHLSLCPCMTETYGTAYFTNTAQRPWRGTREMINRVKWVNGFDNNFYEFNSQVLIFIKTCLYIIIIYFYELFIKYLITIVKFQSQHL